MINFMGFLFYIDPIRVIYDHDVFKIGDIVFLDRYFNIITDVSVSDFHPHVKATFQKPLFVTIPNSEYHSFLIIDYKDFSKQKLMFSLMPNIKEVYLLYFLQRDMLMKSHDMSWFRI